MAMRCFGRTRFATGAPRALVSRPLDLTDFRVVDLATVLRGGVLRAEILRAGDFFCAAVRAAARDVGFCLAIGVLPFGSERVAQIALRPTLFSAAGTRRRQCAARRA